MVNETIHTHLRHDGGYKFSVTFGEQPGTLQTDEEAPLGEGRGPSPSMMLSTAVGQCLSSSLMFCLQKSRVPLNDIATDVQTSLKRNEKGRWRIDGIKVDIRIAVSDDGREKLERCKGMFEDFCIVTESVRQGITVDVNVHEE